MAVALPPVDANVTIPPSVLKAAEAAEAIHKAAYQQGAEPDPPPQEPVPPAPGDQPLQIPQLPEPPPPEPAPPEPRKQVSESGEHGSWEHRYLAMKGRFDQSQQMLGTMQEQMSQLGDELGRTQQALQLARRAPQRSRQEPPPPSPVTPKDIETYGEDLPEFIARVARGAVAPDIKQVAQQVRQTSQQIQMTAHQRMEVDLDRDVPGWRETNVSQRFKQWVRLRDVYSNRVRAELIDDAVKAADAPRVAAFFNGFLSEEQATGQLPESQEQPEPPPPRIAAVPLGSLATPGKAKPASGNGYANAADKPVFTHAQIRQFYSNAGRAAYVGRGEDRQRDEQEIFAAQREGRVR